jgi:DNA-binding CsgD family transcriptional regulator
MLFNLTVLLIASGLSILAIAVIEIIHSNVTKAQQKRNYARLQAQLRASDNAIAAEIESNMVWRG